MRSCYKTKRSKRNTNLNFCCDCVKQSDKFAQICRETGHIDCTTIMQLLKLYCLFVNFLLKQHSTDVALYLPDMVPCDLFSFSKLRCKLKPGNFASVDKIKSEFLKTLRQPKNQVTKLTLGWINEWILLQRRYRLCELTDQNFFRGTNIFVIFCRHF